MSKTPKIAFIHNSLISETKVKVEELIDELELKEVSWTSSAGDLHLKEQELLETKIAIVVGGDGTILRSSRAISPLNIPVVGIKMGKVGFMAELSPDEAKDKLINYINWSETSASKIRIEERMMLQANITSHNSETPRLSIHALNDITVGGTEVSRLVELEASVNQVHLTNYRADAVIVSTATGSTGYALSAGGPIVFPEAKMMILQPVAAHTGLRDGLILAPDSLIEFQASSSYQASISADGFVDSILSEGEKISIKQSEYTAKFLRAEQPDFFYTALNMRLGLAYRSQRPPE